MASVQVSGNHAGRGKTSKVECKMKPLARIGKGGRRSAHSRGTQCAPNRLVPAGRDDHR